MIMNASCFSYQHQIFHAYVKYRKNKAYQLFDLKINFVSEQTSDFLYAAFST